MHGGIVILEFRRVTRDYEGFEDFMRIYLDSFPPHEIYDIDGLISARHLRVEAAEHRGKVVGLHMTTEDTPITYIAYLAVDRDSRDKGYGGEIFDRIRSEGKPVFLNVEPPDETCSNNPQRLKRIRFYEKHGLKLTDYDIDIEGCTYRIMTDRAECINLYKDTIAMLGFDWQITTLISDF